MPIAPIFEAFDVAAIADLFAYPCQITDDGDEPAVMTVGSREEWIPRLEGLVAGYRAIGVRTAEILRLEATELTPRLAQATIRWNLLDSEGEGIYDFDASYTLADFGRRHADHSHRSQRDCPSSTIDGTPATHMT